MKKSGITLITILLAFLISPVMGWALNVSPGGVSGAGGATITVPINISDVGAGVSADAIGFTINFDSSVLTFVQANKTGTLTEPFSLVSGQVIAPGQVKVNGSLFGTPVSITSAGVLLNLSFTVNPSAYKDSTLILSLFKDDIGTATTTNAAFSITGVTRSVVVTPAATTNVVAGQPVTLTAEVLINGAHLNLTNVADVTFTRTGNGTFGAPSLNAGNLQIAYTTHTTVETANITATENLTGSSAAGNAVVTSIPGALATLTVSPDTATKTADQTQQFTVTGADANNNAVDLGSTVVWSGGAGIGTINATTGLFTANTVGTGTVTATSGAISDTSGTITVTPGALFSITVSPDTATLNADQTQPFTAAGVDADGNAVDLTGTLTWSGGAGIGAINATTGLFTANTVGTGTVTATSSLGKSDSSGTITVTPGAPASMTLTAGNTTLASDQKGTTVLTATILDADGNVVTGDTTTVVTFALSDPAYLTLSSATATAGSGGPGKASVTLTTKAGNVVSPPATSDVSITSAPLLTPPAAQTITIVNFSATPAFPALVTVGTPHATTITAIGATNYTWSKISGNGTLSATTGTTVTLTAPTTITEGAAGHPTVIRVTDTGTPSVFYEMTIKTFAPVQITQPAAAVGITSSGTPNTTQLQVTGGSGAYGYAVNGAAGVLGVDGAGLVTGAANGVRTVYVWDTANGLQATDNSFRAVTPNIEVVAPITVTPATMNLQASKTQQFTAAGGKGGYVWTISNPAAGSVSATGLFTAAAVTANQTATITATDGTYGNIKGTATVTVFPTLAITNAPAVTPTVESGKTYGTVLQAAGAAGTGNYEWKVTTDPSGTFGDWATADTFTFVAPKNNASAGVYEITLRDKTNPTFTSTFQVKVSITLDPASFIFKSGGAAQPFTVSGASAAGTYTWDILSDATMAKVTNVADYGTWTPGIVVTGAATNSFAPAAVTAIKTFYLQVTVEGDADLTADNGLNKNVFGPFRIIPTAAYTVNVKTAAGAALGGATVTVNYTPAPLDATTAGKYIFTLPDTGGTYLYNVSLAGYISKAVSSALKTVDVTLQAVDAAKAISGIVSPFPATTGTTVTAFLPAALATQYSAVTAADGTYTINLPTGAAATGWTVVAGKMAGYNDAAPLTGINAGAAAVNFTLTTITGTAPDAGTGGGATDNSLLGQTYPVAIVVPAGGFDKAATIAIAESPTTAGTPGSPKVYEITATAVAGTLGINRIEITLPVDLSVVKPGGFESGAYVIYHAASAAALAAGQGAPVPWATNGIKADYVGNGTIGSVTFWVNSLSFFGIGAGGGILGAGTEASSGCFIATAAYGSYFEKHVQILRNFRDAYLMTSDWGRAFVGFYYRHSPAIANVIAGSSGLRAAVRLGLAPVVGVAYVTLHTTPVQKALILVLLIGILAAGMVAILRMKKVRRAIG